MSSAIHYRTDNQRTGSRYAMPKLSQKQPRRSKPWRLLSGQTVGNR